LSVPTNYVYISWAELRRVLLAWYRACRRSSIPRLFADDDKAPLSQIDHPGGRAIDISAHCSAAIESYLIGHWQPGFDCRQKAWLIYAIVPVD